MNTFSALSRLGFLALGCGFFPLSAWAYPPAPYHVLYGLVRTEMGDPLTVTNAEVIMETSAGVVIKTLIYPNLGPGLNYRLQVPMDAGLTADAYQPTALQPMVPFRLKVKIGNLTYLPIQMTANYANLGKPAQSTRLDLTLGEDFDCDGLPDAWERALIAALGGNLTLQDIQPGDDEDGDGLSNLQEYLAGTYAFDPQDMFNLSIVGFSGANPLLEFMAIRGHSYSVLSSLDLQTWSPQPFRAPGDAPDTPGRDSYQATDVCILRVEALVPAGQPASGLFFKIKVQ